MLADDGCVCGGAQAHVRLSGLPDEEQVLPCVWDVVSLMVLDTLD